MKFRLWFAFLVGCFTISSVWGQSTTDSIPPTAPAAIDSATEEPAPAEVKNCRFFVQDGKIMIQSPGLNGPGLIDINGDLALLNFEDGQVAYSVDVDHRGKLFLFKTSNDQQLYHAAKRSDGSLRLRHIPFWLSILPPLFAIGLALVFREVIVSLFAGVWIGAFIAGGMRIESLYYFLLSIFEVVSKYVIEALADSDHLAIIVFSMLIGGMVAIISRNGGMAGVVQRLSKYANSPRSSQFITWLLGVAIFFDDYANTLIVGNTMRSVTDRFKVSREKLAYIVDSTAAPVAAVAFITTWIGAELSYISDGVGLLSGFEAEMTAYSIFIQSLKYSFYPMLTLVFILFIIRTGRDYGPMLTAERRARNTGQVSPLNSQGDVAEETEDLSPLPGIALKARNAVIPVAVVILMTIFGLLDTGFESLYAGLVEDGTAPGRFSWGSVWGALSDEGFFLKLGAVIGAANSYQALLWSSLAGVLVAIGLSLGGRIMSLERSMGTLATGFKTMLPAIMILTMAWSLAATTQELHTATFLTQALQDSVNPYLLPPIIFILAAFISFSTGSSWSTMAILYPLAIPITWTISQANGLDTAICMELLFNVISTVLAASVLGDHCSPISDTTILSSLASDCNHIDHVRTQLPYALTVGIVSLLCGTLSTLMGGGWGICFLLLAIGLVALYGVVRVVGKPVTPEA